MTRNDYIKKIIPLAILVAICSEVYFYPLNTYLRISLGIIILNTLILIRDDLKLTPIILFSGIIIFIERTLAGTLFNPLELSDPNLMTYGLHALPALIYYFVFSTLIYFSNVKSYKDQMFRIISTLAGIDIISNMVEGVIRGDFSSRTFTVIILVGIIRSIIAYSIYFVWRRKELFILRQEHQKRYSQLNMMVANVESELFYLKKSAGDIEDVMGKCYRLYENAEGEKKDDLLNIAKDIHEIKKDYIRVMDGFSDFVGKVQDLEHLSISDIFDIIKTNYNKSLKNNTHTIDLAFEQNTNPQIEYYLSLFTILNNLIDNSIQAFKKDGLIRIIFKETGSSHQLMVMDNGPGMSEQVQHLIFNPGFTTKYNPEGKASTGIGLTHVKNTVNTLGGTIEVSSIKESGTKFTIILPKAVMRK